MNRKPLINLTNAKKLWGEENVIFTRPRYIPEGYCEWCGKLITNKRRKSCCSEACTKEYGLATSPVYYDNKGSRGGYGNHIFRRDNYTCQKCGVFHGKRNEHGIYLPTTDGHLHVHHKKPVSRGGDDSPTNLITWCDACHIEWHKENGVDY